MPQDDNRTGTASANGAQSSARGLDRRTLLAAVAALSGLGSSALAQETTDALSAQEFRDLLSGLTGFSPRDASLIEAFREAFASDIESLKMLSGIVVNTPESEWPAAIKNANLEPLAESLVNTAYTGISGDGANARVITYLNAFVWYAVGYTKPPSQCDWNFGAWAYPPPRGRFDE